MVYITHSNRPSKAIFILPLTYKPYPYKRQLEHTVFRTAHLPTEKGIEKGESSPAFTFHMKTLILGVR